MKKVTIITPPEFEGLVLESVGNAGITQLTEVSGLDFEGLQKLSETGTNYKELYQKVHGSYLKLSELGDLDIHVTPDMDWHRRFASAPEAEVSAVLDEFEQLMAQFKETKEAQISEVRRLEGERLKLKARLESLRALQPEEFKSCLALGVVKNEAIKRLEEYLKRYPDITHKEVTISQEESFLYIFGSEGSRRWVETLFVVFDVKDIFNVLDSGDILLVLDPEKWKEAIDKYQKELKQYEDRLEAQALGTKEILEVMRKQAIEKYQEELKQYDAQLERLKAEHMQALGKVEYLDNLLRILSDDRVSALRTKVISVLQGWLPDKRIPELEKAMSEVESTTGEKIFVLFEDPGHEDHNVPTPPPEVKPSFLQPAWTLTSLRGWPSPHEVNPIYISIIVFSFQFGLMFGDVGQGAIFLLLGLIFTRKFKRGMASKIGVMFIPMGIMSIIFGFLYGEVFLIEGMIHPILFSPLHSIGPLMKMVLGIAVLEICLSLVISSINHIKERDYLGTLGQHGLGAILFIVGLYLGGLTFLSGVAITQLFNHWTFYMMLGGLVLSAIMPLISAFTRKQVGIDVMGEMISALMMTFVESLASFFSFLRIAAFALAHASLALAAESLSHTMSPALGLFMTNAIAMTFEFMSSSVQSLRLLYYEFMSRFFHGTGTPFKPFTLPRRKDK